MRARCLRTPLPGCSAAVLAGVLIAFAPRCRWKIARTAALCAW